MLTNEHIFKIKTNEDFESTALEVFRFQAQNCAVYKQYINLLGINPEHVKSVSAIPFLPIQFFKTQTIYSSKQQPAIVFSSSGTTGMETSKHLVADAAIYERSFVEGFRHFYGNPDEYTILALLPSYLEREGSSLIYMVEHLIKMSGDSQSGFYLHNKSELYKKLLALQQSNRKTLLIGVSFALLDFVEEFAVDFPNLIVMETGGMKGRRRELPRNELHQALCKGFGVCQIHSEYGMTELLSQAYSKGDGLFFTPPWMRVLIRDVQNPLAWAKKQTTGGVNIVDLANVYSCSFIETQDLGKVNADGGFEIQGRFDESDIRGCNLLVIDS